jgi:toxin ParE1/3/4
MRPVKYHRLAWREYILEFRYYERRQAGLGFDFEKYIEEAERNIQSSPKLYAFYGKTPARACPVDVFPFTLYFVEHNDRFLVYAVAHHKRRPGYWARRLKRP